ncbi:MAG: hypothetical protein HQM08_13210 [Candidatus Riflebacteria bacterium]|nr:hypothetical protein [Candidatus Riflebacteria bacterium]
MNINKASSSFLFFSALLFIFLFVLPVQFLLGSESDFWHEVTGPAAERVFIPGDPPLKMGSVNAFLNCVEYGFSLALTEREEMDLRNGIMDEFLSFKGKLVENLKHLSELWKVVINAKPDKRQMYKLILKESLQKETEKNLNSSISQKIAFIQKQSESLTSSNPPISKRCVEALEEIIQFALKLRDRNIQIWSKPLQDEFEKTLILRIPELTPLGRAWLSNADIHRSIILKSWRNISNEEKKTVRELLIKTFAPANHGKSILPISLEDIPIPPPNFFPLPSELPWPMR